MRRRRHALAILSATSVMLVAFAFGAGASGLVPPSNPSANLAPSPRYTFTSASTTYGVGQALPACWRWGSSTNFVPQGSAPACITAEIQATDRAHHVEGLAAVALPRNYSHLSVAEQLLVLVDIERVSRGETPVLGLAARLNTYAQQGAAHNADPVLPSAGVTVAGATGAWASNYAGAVNPLDANYVWMYQDGWQGATTANYDCTGPHAPGCWGHRDNILTDASRMPCNQGACALVMGAGFVNRGSGHNYSSFTELLVQVAGSTPSLYYTWSRALAAGARA